MGSGTRGGGRRPGALMRIAELGMRMICGGTLAPCADHRRDAPGSLGGQGFLILITVPSLSPSGSALADGS
jgi:hypothetical protein